MDNSGVTLNSLCKSFRGVAIVDRVSLKIDRCELFGLLGPNSAVNSTIITILATMLRPFAGIASVMVRGIAQDRDVVRFCIDIIFRAANDGKLIGSEIPDLHARLHKVDRNVRGKRIYEVSDIVDMREIEAFDDPKSKWRDRG